MIVKVLLIDAEVEFLDLARSLLAGHPGIAIVGTARSGDEALALLGLRPDGVILDAHLPGAGGFDLARRLIASSPRLRVILLSAFHQAEYEALALAAGAVAYLAKKHLSAETVYRMLHIR